MRAFLLSSKYPSAALRRATHLLADFLKQSMSVKEMALRCTTDTKHSAEWLKPEVACKMLN